ARPAARADGTAVRSDAALRRGARGEPGRPGAARRAGAALRLDVESGIEPRRYRRSGAIAQRRVEALSQESLAPLLASAVAPREGRDAPLRSRARSPRLRASGQSGVLERARLSADGSVRPPRRGKGIHPKSARDGSRQRGDHRQHGLGAVQARRLRVGVRLSRPRVSARAGPRDRRSPRRRALGARPTGEGARAARRGAREESGQPPPERGRPASTAMIRALLIAAALLLAACEPRLTLEHDGLGFDERRERLAAVSSWRMQGRLAIDTGERAAPGRFSWLHDDEVSTLLVRGPLGGGVLEVTRSPDGMTVTARGERRELADPETDLSALLGWWMPVESLDA